MYCMHVKAVVLHLILGSKSVGVCEQLVEVSRPAGCGLSSRDKSEQDYLLALYSQYEVEHYEDCYDIMGEFKTRCRACEYHKFMITRILQHFKKTVNGVLLFFNLDALAAMKGGKKYRVEIIEAVQLQTVASVHFQNLVNMLKLISCK